MAELFVDGDAPRRADDTAQFSLRDWIDTAPFEDLLGMKIEEVASGRAVLTMPFTVKLAQGGGVLHGGACTALADTAVAMAIKALLPAHTVFATTELTTRFLRPVKEGRVTAVASVTGPEGRTFLGEATLFDGEGEEVARFGSVFRVARGQGFED